MRESMGGGADMGALGDLSQSPSFFFFFFSSFFLLVIIIACMLTLFLFCLFLFKSGLILDWFHALEVEMGLKKESGRDLKKMKAFCSWFSCFCCLKFLFFFFSFFFLS